MTTRCLAIATLALLLLTPILTRAADATRGKDDDDDANKSPIYEKNLSLEVTFSRDSKKIDPDWDARVQTISPSVKVTNNIAKESYEGLQVDLYVIGESATKEKFLVLLIAKHLTFDLGPRESKQTPVGMVRLNYDKEHSVRWGIKYDSYVAVLRDKDGKIITTKGTRTSLSQHADDLAKLRPGDVIDKYGQKDITRRIFVDDGRFYGN